MNESEWLSCADPIDMLMVPPGTNISARKVRLFLAGCCRRIWDSMTAENKACVESAEAYAESLISQFHLRQREENAAIYVDEEEELPLDEDQPDSWWCDLAAWRITSDLVHAATVCDATRRVAGETSGEWEEVVQARMLRCVAGNPFHPVAMVSDWITPSITEIARQIDARSNFTLLPTLAEELKKNGCTQPDILSHLASPGPHIRGCWVIDLLLGKQ